MDSAFKSNSEKFYKQLIYQKDLYVHYIGHKARLIHESKRREINQRRCILGEQLFLVTCDYAMKFLAYKFRETQSEWFRKKGFAWHGCWLVWFDKTLNSLLGTKYVKTARRTVKQLLNVYHSLLKSTINNFRNIKIYFRYRWGRCVCRNRISGQNRKLEACYWRGVYRTFYWRKWWRKKSTRCWIWNR